MKTISTIIIAGALLATSGVVSAISLSLTSFNNTHVNSNLGTGGGVGTFIINEAFLNFNVGDILLAMCLEPNELVSVGRTYDFDLVALANAPTSGGFGGVNAKLLETYVEANNWEDFASNTPLENKTLGILAWEGGHDAVYDLTAGNITFPPQVGFSEAQSVLGASYAPGIGDGITAYGLLNGSFDNNGKFTSNGKQDFMFFQTVPEPSSLMLMGLALLGFVGNRKIKS